MRNHGFAVALAAAVIGSALGATTAPAQDHKAFSLAVGPDRVERSSAVEMTARITNESKSAQKLGSANITVPAAFTNLSLRSASGAATLSGHTVELRNLQLLPGQTATAVIRATAPASAGRYFWDAQAKQSDNFSEQSNDWSLIGDAAERDTNVFAPPPPPPPPPPACDLTTSGNGPEGCTARHYVPLTWVQQIKPTAGPGSYWVDTTVITPAAGQLTIGYLSPGAAGNQDSACDGPVNYIEPADVAARFTGPSPKTVTFTLSADLAAIMREIETQREACLSAPDPFVPREADLPFVFEGQLWNNGLAANCPVLAGPCVNRNATTDSAVVIEFPNSIFPDPMNR